MKVGDIHKQVVTAIEGELQRNNVAACGFAGHSTNDKTFKSLTFDGLVFSPGAARQSKLMCWDHQDAGVIHWSTKPTSGTIARTQVKRYEFALPLEPDKLATVEAVRAAFFALHLYGMPTRHDVRVDYEPARRLVRVDVRVPVVGTLGFLMDATQSGGGLVPSLKYSCWQAVNTYLAKVAELAQSLAAAGARQGMDVERLLRDVKKLPR